MSVDHLAPLERLFVRYERAARALLAQLEPLPARHDRQAPRDRARVRAARFVLASVAALRRTLAQPALGPADRALLAHAAIHLGRYAEDAVLDRWYGREAHARQAAIARAAAAAYQARHRAARAVLLEKVNYLRAAHPHLSTRALARLIDPAHVDSTRKRIARLIRL
jgi:hypothetical protein